MPADELSEFKTAYRGQGCTVRRREQDWLLSFAQGEIAVATPWRIVQDGRTAHGRDDDHQQFGLPDPIDGEVRANALLSQRRVDMIELDPVTADLRLYFADGTRLDVFNGSSGYEGWQAWFGSDDEHVLIIGGGGGRVTVFPSASASKA